MSIKRLQTACNDLPSYLQKPSNCPNVIRLWMNALFKALADCILVKVQFLIVLYFSRYVCTCTIFSYFLRLVGRICILVSAVKFLHSQVCYK